MLLVQLSKTSITSMCLMLFGLAAWAQEPILAPAPIEVGAGDENSYPEQELNPVLACLRIPASLIAEEASQSFEHNSSVDRVVLGTHSRGTANCQGEVRCELRDQAQAVEFVCHISGTVSSQTHGSNGPALIDSTAETSYTAAKSILFDGRQLSTQPAVVTARTRVQVTGIGSTLPGLRGRMVKRVAARRAADSLPEAEAITRKLTVDELRQQIDDEFAQRLTSLNRKLALRLAILESFSESDYSLSLSSHADYIQVLFARRGIDSQNIAATPNFPLGPKVVLWIPLPSSNSDLREESEILDSWGLEDAAKFLPLWLSVPLLPIKATVDARTPRVDLLHHAGWIGFEIDHDTIKEKLRGSNESAVVRHNQTSLAPRIAVAAP
jgi:hypothetical protein